MTILSSYIIYSRRFLRAVVFTLVVVLPHTMKFNTMTFFNYIAHVSMCCYKSLGCCLHVFHYQKRSSNSYFLSCDNVCENFNLFTKIMKITKPMTLQIFPYMVTIPKLPRESPKGTKRKSSDIGVSIPHKSPHKSPHNTPRKSPKKHHNKYVATQEPI